MPATHVTLLTPLTTYNTDEIFAIRRPARMCKVDSVLESVVNSRLVRMPLCTMCTCALQALKSERSLIRSSRMITANIKVLQSVRDRDSITDELRQVEIKIHAQPCRALWRSWASVDRNLSSAPHRGHPASVTLDWCRYKHAYSMFTDVAAVADENNDVEDVLVVNHFVISNRVLVIHNM